MLDDLFDVTELFVPQPLRRAHVPCMICAVEDERERDCLTAHVEDAASADTVQRMFSDAGLAVYVSTAAWSGDPEIKAGACPAHLPNLRLLTHIADAAGGKLTASGIGLVVPGAPE